MIMPGDRVLVFDHTLYVNDELTPLIVTMRPATVVCRYGKVYSDPPEQYPDLVDVQFDHWEEGKISKGHFTDGVTPFKS